MAGPLLLLPLVWRTHLDAQVHYGPDRGNLCPQGKWASLLGEVGGELRPQPRPDEERSDRSRRAARELAGGSGTRGPQGGRVATRQGWAGRPWACPERSASLSRTAGRPEQQRLGMGWQHSAEDIVARVRGTAQVDSLVCDGLAEGLNGWLALFARLPPAHCGNIPGNRPSLGVWRRRPERPSRRVQASVPSRETDAPASRAAGCRPAYRAVEGGGGARNDPAYPVLPCLEVPYAILFLRHHTSPIGNALRISNAPEGSSGVTSPPDGLAGAASGAHA